MRAFVNFSAYLVLTAQHGNTSIGPYFFSVRGKSDLIPTGVRNYFCNTPINAKDEDRVMTQAKTKDLRRTMSRRGLLLAGGSIMFTGFLVGRLYQLQVAQSNRYRRLSDRNQFDMRIVPPVRGRLFDNKKRLLAGNAESFLLYITPLYVADMSKTLVDLAMIVDLPEGQQRDVIKAASKGPSFRNIIVRDNLSQR